MVDIKGPGLTLLREKENGGGGLNNDILHAMHPTLMGSGLDKMNISMAGNLAASIDQLATSGDVPFDLYLWCRHAITAASTKSVFGDFNPLKSKEIEDAFWAFETNIKGLLPGILPQLTARNPYKAREKVFAAFVEYFKAKAYETSSDLSYVRWKVQHDAGATIEDIAKLEVALCIGLLSNSVPATFWTLFDIYSRPQLVEQIREEVARNALHIDDDSNGGDTPVHSIDIKNIRDSCPLLVSAFQEVLRLRSNGTVTRFVYEDIVLNDEYLLKGGAILQLPVYSVNRDEAVWGADAKIFNPLRFMKSEQKKRNGFLSFGMSPNLCPGRQFATGEILGMAAMLILRYDIEPVSGRWDCPVLNLNAMAASFTPPVKGNTVTVSPRSEAANVKWKFTAGEKGKFGLIV